LNRGCFEAVLMKNTPRTLGVEDPRVASQVFILLFLEKMSFHNYVKNYIVIFLKHKEF
jgi:hypothetical protein